MEVTCANSENAALTLGKKYEVVELYKYSKLCRVKNDEGFVCGYLQKRFDEFKKKKKSAFFFEEDEE